MIYLDTACLVKLYYPEPDSAKPVLRFLRFLLLGLNGYGPKQRQAPGQS